MKIKKITKKDFSRPSKIRKIIDELKRLDLSSEDVTLETLKPYIDKIHEGHVIIKGAVNFDRLYRARINKKNESYQNIKELWFPKPEIINKYGRINNIGKNYLYCSNSQATAVTEIGAKIGDTVTVLECKLKNPGILPVTLEIGIRELTSVEIRGNRKRIATERINGVAAYLSPRGVNVNEIMRKFTVEEFTKIVKPGQEYNYKISISIAEMYFSNDRLDALLYPSIPTAYRGHNVVFKPESADLLLTPISVQELTIAEILPPKPDGSGAGYGAHYRNAMVIGVDGGIVWYP
jgi:hypothetical protein